MSRPIQPDGKLHGVVVAVVREADGKYLCVRRSAHVPAPLKVCFPGGGVEVGESQESAVVREMREELGIAVRPVRRCWEWDSPDKPLKLWGWTAVWTEGELAPDPKEIHEVLWLSVDEVVGHPDALPTNRAFVSCLRQSANDDGRLG